MSDEYTLPVNDDIYITGETEEVVPNFSEIDDDDSTQETVTRTPAVISSDNRSSIGSGELNPSPSDAVPADVSTSDVIVTQRVRHQIDDYEPAALKALSDAGAVFYAVYADDHEEGPVSWTEVHDLDPEGTIIELDEEIASAIAQNFWADTQGVHITDDPYNEWIEAYESNPQFPNLSTTKNYYNILLNAGGALLRRALNNLVSINRTAISFYDGLGNASTNIMAFFGRNGAQIGRSDEKHVVINSSGIGSYNGDGTVADFTMRGSSIVNSTISGSALVDNTITGGKIANATITGAKIDSGTITNANIQDGTITGAKIDAGTITNANIQDGTIQGSKIQGSTLTDIPFAAITDAEVEVASIADAQISTATISEAQVENLTTDYAHLTQGVIDNAKIDHADVNGLSANYATISNLNAATGRIGALEADHVSVEDFEAEQGYIDALQAATADIGTIRADSAKVHSLTAAQLSAATGYIAALNADNITAASLSADVGKIHNLTANELSAAAAYIAALNADSVTAQNIIAMNGDFATVKANAAKVANLTAAQLEADHATIGALDTTYAQINMANVNNAWITNGVIKDGAISSAMINDVSANKLTAGTINGSVINVTNLNADNITTGTINGQRIGEGSLSLDKLSDDVYTEAEVDAKLSTMQSQIDGAIETWTGTAVPTLQNSPASSWNTTALKDSHVGDVYFVVNSQSQQNGYNYRFTKSGSTYSWQLIKDSDVTNALQRLTTAEGKITTFDSDISQLKTDTGTLTTKTTSLETRMSDAEADILDKVDTTTFNEVSDTVDSHSQSITQMTTTLSNKADSSTVSAVTQRVSKNEQDISGINTTIGELETTVESKADGSTVETMSTKLNTVSDTVDGHTQSISSINSTLSTKADSSTVSTLTTKVNNVSDTVEGHTSQLSSITQTQTSIQKNAVKSTVQLWFTKADTTAPAKPTAHVSTNNAATGNAWNLAVPTYNSAYPNYYYCYEYQYVDGSYGWSAVTRDIATGEMQATARQAQADIDGLEIGGRNLLRNTNWNSETIKQFKTSTSSTNVLGNAIGEWHRETQATLGFDASGLMTITVPNNTTRYGIYQDVSLSPGHYILSVDTGSFFKSLIDSAQWPAKNPIDGSNSRNSVEIDVAEEAIYRVYIAHNNGSVMYGNHMKLEKGSRATDWTPAPEDVDADISTAQTSADNAQATANKNIKESQQLWFTKANGSAPNKPASKVTSTSTGGNAWTTKVPTYNENYKHYFYCMQYIAADGTVTWSDVVYDQATTEAQSVARTTSANLSTLQSDYATFKQTTQNFESTIGTTYATKTELQTTDNKIENLEIGGRNLLPSSIFTDKGITGSTKELGPVSLGTMYSYFGNNDRYIFGTFEENTQYTFRVGAIQSAVDNTWVGHGGPQFGFRYTDGTQDDYITRITFLYKDEAELVYKTLVSDPTKSVLNIYVTYGYGHSNWSFYDMKLEKGNKATDWTPAPEDVDAAIEASPKYKYVTSAYKATSQTYNTWLQWGQEGRSITNFGLVNTAERRKLNIGDLACCEGWNATDNKPIYIVIEVTEFPSTTSHINGISHGLIDSEIRSTVNAIESRVSTAETSITQTNNQIALKANASDVYTKTQTDGLISTEASNRNSAIQQSADAITTSVSQTYATKTALSTTNGNVTALQNRNDTLDAQYGYPYKKDVIVYGESNKYYPVYFTNTGSSKYDQYVTHEVMIKRGYSEQGPNDWNPSSSAHHGSLNLHFGWNYGGWGGATYKCDIYEFSEMYSTLLGDILVGVDGGMFSIVYLRGGGTTGAIYHIYSDVPFIRHGYMTNAGVVGENDVPYVGLEQNLVYAQNGDATYQWKVRAPLTTPNVAHLTSLKTNTSMRFTLVRSNWNETYWASCSTIGHTDNWKPNSPTASSSTYAIADCRTLNVGDTFAATGVSTDKSITHSIVCEVTAVPIAEHGDIPAKTIAVNDNSVYAEAVESRVSTAETSIQQNTNSIALKANSSDVYTKTQTDGLISTEVSNRNSAIEQSANAINLSVSQTYTTKTEFNALEIGGRNLLLRTGSDFFSGTSPAIGGGNIGSAAVAVVTDDAYPGFEVLKTTRGNVTTSSGRYMYAITNRTTDGALVAGETYTLSFWAKAETNGLQFVVGNIVEHIDSISESSMILNDEWTRYWLTFKIKEDGSYIRPANCFYTVGTANGVYYVTKLKLEKGNRATDWTPAPEDMVSQTEFESAKSEIKATTDGITSTVSKISSVKYYTGGSSTLSNIKVWAAEGYTSTWTFTGDLSNLRIGDTVYLKYGDTTRGCNVYIKGTVNSISGQSVNFTAHGYEDVLPVDTIKSTINQSADSVKIEARHVNIEGAAIFSSGRLSETSLNNAYDTKGAAASLVAGGDNLIGGFNNSYVGNGEYNYRTGRFQSKTTLNTADNAVILQYYSGTTPTNAGTYVSQHADAFRVANVGETCSFKFEKPSGFTHLHLKFNGNQQDARVAWDVASIPVGTELILTFKLDSISSDGKGNGGVMSGINLRTGNMPSQWSLAPDDVDVATSADLNTVKSNAVKRTQRIYCRKSSVGAPSTPGISSSNWVTQTSDVFGQWTAKVPRLTANADGTGTKYLYLYTCEQREMGDGTLSYTTVLLDDSNTIIDGGTIITGSIAANKLDVYDASINKIRAESIDLRGYSNDEIEVGGRNLLLFSQFLSKDGATVYGYGSSANTYGFDGTYKGCTVWSATKTKTSGSAEMLTADAAKVSAWVVGPNESYILSFWAKASAEIGITSYFYRGENNTCNLVETSTGYVGTSSDGSATLSIGTGWKRYWVRWHFNDNTDPSLRKNLIIARAQASTTGTVWIAGPKLEKGNKATDWTPAPEDVEADISSKADPDDIPTKVSDLTNDSGFQNSSEVETAITSKGYATQNSLNSEINQRKAQYGTCSTAAATQAKEVTCSNFELVAGNELTVKFSTANTYASGAVQLNVNSKGAKNVWVANAVTSSSNQLLWGADAYITFRYDGTQFIVIGEPRAWYGASTTAEGTAAKTDTTAVTGCVICKGAKVELAMTNANTATAPTLNIQSTGAKNVYFGNGTARPTKANGTSWLATNTCTFTFDGQYWRTAGKTYIDANSIVTGYLSADRIEAGSLSANKISATSGTFDTANIPDLSAAKIVTGYLSADRIEAGSLSANKISAASGTFDTANIPNLDAAKITSGTIDAARINASALTIDSQTLGVSIGRLNNIVTAGDDEDDVVFTEDALSAMGRNVHVSAGNVDISTDESTGNVTSLTDTLGMLATTDQVDELDNSVTNLLDNVSNVQDYVNPLTSWINITEVPTSGGGTEPALQMGTTEGNAPVMQLTNSMLQFRMLGDANPLLKMGVVDGESLLEIMKVVVLKELRFNNFAFIARPNGNVCLKYIGRD